MAPKTVHVEVVVITKASAGVGRAVARTIAREGAVIGLLVSGRETLEATAVEVKELGGTPFIYQLDVANSIKCSLPRTSICSCWRGCSRRCNILCKICNQQPSLGTSKTGPRENLHSYF